MELKHSVSLSDFFSFKIMKGNFSSFSYWHKAFSEIKNFLFKGGSNFSFITVVFLLLTGLNLSAQTTFTANTTGNWTTIAWVKTGPSTASYPGQPGYEAEIHDVVINGAGITVLLNSNISTSIRNVTLTSGILNIRNFSLTMTGNLTGGSTLAFTSGTLNIGGNNNSSGPFIAGAGTINYNGGAQIIRGTTYYNLTISGTNSKPLGGNVVISNNFTILSAQVDASTRDITVNGLMTIFPGGSFTPGSPAGADIFNNITLNGGSIVSISGVAPVIDLIGNLVITNNEVSSITKIRFTVGGTTDIQAGSALLLNGNAGTGTFDGLVTIDGSWINSANNDCDFRNGLVLNGPLFTSGTATYTFDTNSQSLTGSSPFVFDGNVTIGSGGIVLTNSATVTIRGILSAVNNTVWRNDINSVLNYENANIPMGNNVSRVLDVSANPNIVNYSGTLNQSVKGTAYYNLIFSGSGIKTLAGATSVNGNLAITGTATLLTNQFQVTGNGTGTFSMAAGTSLLLGNPAVATNVAFPTIFVPSNVSFDPTSTVSYQARIAQTVSAVPVYGNLTTASSGIKTLANNITVVSDLTIGVNTTLDASVNNYNINLSGSWINNGNFNERQGKVTFNGTGPQSILNTLIGSETFYNLEFNTAGPVTAAIDLASANNLSMTNGIVLMPGKTFLLGSGAANPGILTYVAGWITGTFSRWAVPAHNNNDLLFPVGINSVAREINLNFTSISSAGVLSVNFIETPPTTSGLPLVEDIYNLAQLFPEGYWNLLKDGLFSFTGTFDLRLVPAGFVTYPIDANTRIVSRFTGSDWFLNGTHSPGSSAMLYRNDLSSFTNNYAVAFAEICNPSLINCPTDIVTISLPGSCGNTATWIPPVISLPCPGYSITSNFNPGDNFDVGITQVVYYLWNGAAKRDSCKFKVTLLDVEAPVVLCKNIDLYLGSLGSATLTGSDIDNGSHDNCSLLLVPARTTFTCMDAGLTIPVILTGTDPSGNSATCTSQVTVRDTISPVINTRTATVMLDATGNGTLLASDIDNGTFDNCTGVTLSVSPSSFSCTDQGQKTVLFTATDAYGNSRSASVVITVASSLTITSTSLSNCDLAGPFALYKSNVIGGDGNYTYLWHGLDNTVDPFVTITGTFPFLVFSNITTAETPFFNNLMPDGTYIIRLVVTDGNGCKDSSDMEIVKAGLIFNNVTVRFSSACEGTVVTYSVADDPLATYNWGVENGTILTTPLNTSTVNVLWNTGVTRGVVIATASKTNLLGEPCESTVVDTVSVSPPPSPVFDNPLTTVCYNSVTTYTLTELYSNYTWTVTGGAITAGGTGTSFVSVRWGAGPTGKVEVTVDSGPGCSNSTFADINIYNLTGSLTSLTNVTCNGAGNGKVTVEATAGTGLSPYEYSLDGGPYQSPGSFTGILPGIHDVTIRDAFFCTFDVNFSITQPPLLSATISRDRCCMLWCKHWQHNRKWGRRYSSPELQS